MLKFVIFKKKEPWKSSLKIWIIGKLGIIATIQVFNFPNKIPVGFHGSSNYVYHFILTELANESDWQFEYLGENTKSTKPFQFQ